MNKRILELAEQAWTMVSNEERSNCELYEAGRQRERRDQVFAELIVRKCLSDCEAVKEQFYNGVIATTDVELKNRFAEAEAACDMIKTKIEMRFGVEQ